MNANMNSKPHYHRVNFLLRAWLHVLHYWHDDQAWNTKYRTIPIIQDEVNRGVTALSVLTEEKAIQRHHEARAREIKARLGAMR